MKMEIDSVEKLLEKINKLVKKEKIDLSKDEDLSIAVMNLISIEEHLYFSGMKTNKKKFFILLNQVRGLRKKLLKKIVKNPEGEVWCISKHLLAASMRLMEVGNKYLAMSKEKEAYESFKDAFYLYSLFWILNLKMSDNEEIIKEQNNEKWKSRIITTIKKIIDCCKE